MPGLLSYRNQSIDLLCKSIDWFLYGVNTGIQWVNLGNIFSKIFPLLIKVSQVYGKQIYFGKNQLRLVASSVICFAVVVVVVVAVVAVVVVVVVVENKKFLLRKGFFTMISTYL